MRGLIVTVAFLAAGSAAFASGYDDYMRGFEARHVGNADLALSAYTAALAAPDLAPTYVPDAHVGRAEALMRKGRCGEAIADLDAAIALRPSLIEALTLRAQAHNCAGQGDAALADLDSAIAAAPTTALFALRGEFRWYRGEFALAAEDYLKGVKAQNKRTFEPRQGLYGLLGYAISATRAKTFDAAAFKTLAHDLPDDEWPAPIVAFIAGTAKLDEVYREAARGEGDAPAFRKCQADFFIAEWQYGNGDPAGKELLLSLEKTCPKNAAVLRDARHDIKRIP
jgi:tetratricopeptide (TPR) repeat protein